MDVTYNRILQKLGQDIQDIEIESDFSIKLKMYNRNTYLCIK